MQRLELTFPVPQTAGIPLWSACRWWLPSCKCVRFLRLMRVLWGEAFEASGRRDRSAIKHLVWRSFSISEKWKWNEEKRIDLSVAACNWLLSSIHSPCYHGSRILLLSSHAHTWSHADSKTHPHTFSVHHTVTSQQSAYTVWRDGKNSYFKFSRMKRSLQYLFKFAFSRSPFIQTQALQCRFLHIGMACYCLLLSVELPLYVDLMMSVFFFIYRGNNRKESMHKWLIGFTGSLGTG